MNALHTKKSTLSLAILLLLTSGALMAENKLNTQGSDDSAAGAGADTIYTDQKGSTSAGLISIYQVANGTAGAKNEAGNSGNALTQTGATNTLIIGQFAPAAGNVAAPVAPATSLLWTGTGATGVNSNLVKSSQSGKATATVLQETSKNTADITQGGGTGTHTIEIIQAATNGVNTSGVKVTQSGNGAHAANIYQYDAATPIAGSKYVLATQTGATANSLTYYQTGGTTTDGTASTHGITQEGGDTATIVQSGGILDVYQHGTSGVVTIGAVTGTKIAAVASAGEEGLVSGSMSIEQSGSTDSATVHFVNADTGSVTWTQSGSNTTGILTQGTNATTGTATAAANITQSGNFQDGTFVGTSSNNFTATLATSGATGAHAIINAKY